MYNSHSGLFLLLLVQLAHSGPEKSILAGRQQLKRLTVALLQWFRRQFSLVERLRKMIGPTSEGSISFECDSLIISLAS